MKKLVILASVLLVASSFAFEPKMSGTLVQTIGSAANSTLSLPSAGAATEGKSRITLSGKVSDATSVTYIFDPLATNAPDYLYVDSALFGGKARFGTVKMYVANYGGGVFQTNKYCSIVETTGGFKATGVAYMSNLAGFDYTAVFTGGYNANAIKRFSVIAKNKLDAINYSVYGAMVMQASSVGDKSGLMVGMDADTKIAGFNLAGQVFTTLGDDSGAVIFSNAGAKTVAAGYVSYMLSDVKVYLDYVMGLSDSAKTLAAIGESEMKIGATLPLNADVNFNIEGMSAKASGVDAVNTAQIGIELKI